MRSVRAYRRDFATLSGVLLLALLCAGSLRVYQRLPSPIGHQEQLYYPSGRFLREATVGFREVAADWLWFQTVQYYGAYRKGEHDLRYFRGLIDSVVHLDPRFVQAYYFGALVHCMDEFDLDTAIDLLKRGILANPDTWVLPFNIGFMNYVFLKDYPRASVWFDAAADRPDATDFARRFAAFARKRAGNLEGSLALWQNLYRTTKDPNMKALAERMIADCRKELAARPPDHEGEL